MEDGGLLPLPLSVLSLIGEVLSIKNKQSRRKSLRKADEAACDLPLSITLNTVNDVFPTYTLV
jgi:hypothetical protein